MVKNKKDIICIGIAILSLWTGLMFVLYELTDIGLFLPGDFSFRTAMAYHGILIPAWLMLALAYLQYFENSGFVRKLSGIGAISAGILTGTGSALIHTQGFSPGTVIQVSGMIVAEVTVLVIIIKSFLYHFKMPREDINTEAWWTVTIGLLGISLATPLGHLAGMAKDFGNRVPLLLKHAEISGITPENMINGFTGSHSHQILAAFLTAGFAMPFIKKPAGNPGVVVRFMEKSGLFIMATATIVQVVLYQYCAWSGWEPPDLFSNGVNGLPLDDLVLVVLGLGMLLLLPGFLAKDEKDFALKDYSWYVNRFAAILLVFYMISVVILGLYIEFHEQYFGFGEGNAPGVLNDMAYIRAHLLFGFMIVPVFLGTWLNANFLNSKRQLRLAGGFAVLAITLGFIGTFVWIFMLNSLILKISVALMAGFLLIFGVHLAKTGVKGISTGTFEKERKLN